MVPVRLRLRNFLSYREACEELDFTGLDFVCLTGENGHGKSALLDAITWALWGAARTSTDDDLIHRGCSEAEVELDFRVGEVLYRINRKRRKSAGATTPGKTILEFQVRAEGGWKALTGQSPKDTERRIIEAVRLDFDTFRNSAFLAQGRADEFTTRTAGKRIEVLAGILGLDAYERYERRARDEARRHDGDARRFLTLQEQLELSLESEPRYQREAQESRAAIAQFEAEITAARLVLAAAQEAERAARTLQQQGESLDRDIAQASARAARAEAEAQQANAAIATHHTLLDRAEAIRADHAALQEARGTVAEQTARLTRLRALEGEAAMAQRALDAARAKLEAEDARHDVQITRLTALLAASEGLEQRTLELNGEREALAREQQTLDGQREAAREADRQATEIASENKRRRTDMEEIKRKQAELAEGGADCPICGTLLGEAGKTRIRDLYERDGKELAAQYRAQSAEQTRLVAEAAHLHGAVAALEKRLTTSRSDLDRRAATLAHESEQAREAAAQLPELQTRRQQTRSALERGEFAPEPRAALSAARAQIGATAYDAGLHERATAAVVRLAAAEQEHAALIAAAEGLQQAEANLARASEACNESRGELTGKTDERRKVSEQLRDYGGAAERLRDAEQGLRGLEEQDRRQRVALGAAEQQLQNCRDYRLKLQAARAQHTAAKQQKQIYDDLTTAFGKRGVQALIVDAAVPEIEEEANNLLRRMTDGHMSVKIETQKLTQRGQPVETLDIAISDDLGTRPYELYSGGEAFRINLALRIALAKLLARRAGAPLPTLIIDEGFGTQDADGRERLMEALSTVAQDFECLIVITHLDELKDRFERRIVVEKTPAGSIATIV